MKQNWRRLPVILCLSLLTIAALPTRAFAATKTISGVTVRVQSKLEAGDTLQEDDVVIGGEPSDGQASVTVSSERCSISEIKILSSLNKVLKIGDEVRVRVRLTPDSGDDYAFKGSYSSSNVKVSGGDFSSASRSSGDLLVTLKLRPVKGTYDTPYDAEWKDSGTGHAKWSAPDYSSGHYDIVLRRNGSDVVRKYDVGSITYNFYPYMTKEGTYSFKVRTTPHSTEARTYGKASEWVESDEYYLDEDDVSDGSGQTDTDGKADNNTDVSGAAGWVRNNGVWYYKYPDGSYKKNGWEKVSGKWYKFDGSGKMQTGWQTTASGTYYLSGSGEMLTGWQNISGSWYLLQPDENSPVQGAMMKNSLVTDVEGKTYYLNDKGQQVYGWFKVDGHWSYFDPQTGVMARNTVVNTFRVDENGVWIQ